MAIVLAAPRHARMVVLMLSLSMLAGARAEDVPPSAATPSGPKSGAAAAAAAEQHRLPPDSTTWQELALPGRTLTFTATAGSIRLFDDKGEPQADIATTAYQLDGTDSRNRPGTF